jgi:low affinity Fe/Cu permease
MPRGPGIFERFAQQSTYLTGTSWAFLIALASVLLWALTGPLFGYSDSWQLVINTSTTIITFLMVFLIQRTQNKESLAIQLKLNELVAAVRGASNRLINIEDLSEAEVQHLRAEYKALLELARQEADFTKPHSIEEAEKLLCGPTATGNGATGPAGQAQPPAPPGENSGPGTASPAMALDAIQAELKDFSRAARILQAILARHQRRIDEHLQEPGGLRSTQSGRGSRHAAPQTPAEGGRVPGGEAT